MGNLDDGRIDYSMLLKDLQRQIASIDERKAALETVIAGLKSLERYEMEARP